MRNPSSPKPLVLLVEGPDDKHVVMHLCRGTELEDKFDIQDKGGKDPLISAIRNEVRVSGRRAVGILLDADNDVQSRWGAVVHALSRAQVTAPTGRSPKSISIVYRSPTASSLRTRHYVHRFMRGLLPVRDRA